MIWANNLDEILKVGNPLFESGVKNWALRKEDALIAIEKIFLLDVAILGGDVYIITDNFLKPNYDSWYCDRLEEESRYDFTKRSYLKAKKYIEDYQYNEMDKIFFAIVPN